MVDFLKERRVDIKFHTVWADALNDINKESIVLMDEVDYFTHEPGFELPEAYKAIWGFTAASVDVDSVIV